MFSNCGDAKNNKIKAFILILSRHSVEITDKKEHVTRRVKTDI